MISEMCSNVEMSFKVFAAVRTLGALETVLEECDYEHRFEEEEFIQGAESCQEALVNYGNWLEDKGILA